MSCKECMGNVFSGKVPYYARQPSNYKLAPTSKRYETILVIYLLWQAFRVAAKVLNVQQLLYQQVMVFVCGFGSFGFFEWM